MARRWAGLLAGAATLAVAAPPARADGESGDGKIGVPHVVLPVAHLAGAFALRFAGPQPERPIWRGGVLFDEPLYRTVLPEDALAWTAWHVAGDVSFYGALGWSVIDPLTSLHIDAGRSAEMLWMNVEAYAAFAGILYVSQALVGRQRPNEHRFCGRPDREIPAYDVECDSPEANRSFIGGHTGLAATAATLTCLHHARGVYGSAADAGPCVFAVAGAGVTMAARTITGAHYFSDNMLGLGVGALSGLMPYFLHYAWEDDGGHDTRQPATGPLLSWSVSPTSEGLQLGLAGVL